MKRFGLFITLTIIASFFFASCEKSKIEDDPRFTNIGEIKAKINGKEFVSRNASVEFIRYEQTRFNLFSAKIYGENALGDHMTFHVGNIFESSNLSGQTLVEKLYDYNSVTYKVSSVNVDKEFSSKKIIANPNDTIQLYPISVKADEESLFWVLTGVFNYRAANNLGEVIDVSDGEMEIILTDDELGEYNRLLKEYTDFIDSFQPE